MTKLKFQSIAEALQAFVMPEVAKPTAQEIRIRESTKRGERRRKQKARERKEQQIAILDFETDPFDNKSRDMIFPFLAVLWRPDAEPIVIWEEDEQVFVYRVVKAIEDLPGKYMIFAHNGGKFDYMFLVHKLRGKVSFKGRGIMSAEIGNHTLRDSFHLLPESLAALEKQKIDYQFMKKGKRHLKKQEIIDYCISDCANLYFYLSRFINEHGMKISIGAAALAALKSEYEIEPITEATDSKLRPYFFGGRVECVQGKGYWSHGQKLYDINSAYPDAMAHVRHPVGSDYIFRSGKPGKQTAFIRLRCRNNGALMARLETGEVTTGKPDGEFFTTIHEYNMALELNLIHNIEIIECVDNLTWTHFDAFILPLYQKRAEEKALLKTLESGSLAWQECNARQMFYKYLLNNSYGKTAQDPRRYREYYFTDPGEIPPIEAGCAPWEREYSDDEFVIWKRPDDNWRFLNVGTGASITGAVRAKMMKALHFAVNPVYCDTDSIICDDLRNHDLHPTNLGAWDLEKEINELVVCGKKLYAYKTKDGKEYVRSKGASGLSWADLLQIFNGEEIVSTNKAPTLTRTRAQNYIDRRVRSTAKRPSEFDLLERLKA